ncbi:zinc finger protein-like 1 homolog [Uranotaenia lowii]|uniref:zinc finger protein-like 1 homolog n=1 Tax=Uranotaenia lowii TaxID=190385 RepID=UPI00247A79D4|nr:zinc finger protein-like 1 homolog [Uranotaenia lowii]XP_055607621.1 zinc finger protein-like 1 homolog [Uranotaenia lowii]XP_055607630.1 zinc finger protein-like 1 homolog [Uranotaenia lowii]
MGLCKCPKRQVTTQFCFEHRVNVCENCMVVNHTKCTVQSYIQWLKDSDYDSSCTLCGNLLDNEDCVRLICYHVFHWNCLNLRQQSLPANTAPGGHTCPSCSDPIFPPANLVSPVADVLRTRLSQVNWARNVLELPLLLEENGDYSDYSGTTSSSHQHSNNSHNHHSVGVHHHSGGAQNRSLLPIASGSVGGGSGDRPASPHSVVNMESYTTSAGAAAMGADFQASSRRPLLPRESPIGGSDRDDNKYKRRTPAEIFSRWSRRFYAPSSRPPWRRTWFLVVSGMLGFVCIMYVLATLGRRSQDSDDLGDADDGIFNRHLPHEA